MSSENKKLDFNNQQFYLGMDVHKKSWKVTIRTGGSVLKTYSMNPSPQELSKYMHEKYPGGIYHSVYEAGFSNDDLVVLGADITASVGLDLFSNNFQYVYFF